jgi:hypothetical protein
MKFTGQQPTRCMTAPAIKANTVSNYFQRKNPALGAIPPVAPFLNSFPQTQLTFFLKKGLVNRSQQG